MPKRVSHGNRDTLPKGDTPPVIHHITPFLTGDIGKGINKQIKHIPDDDWVCLRDQDTMFLLPHQGAMIEQIVYSNPPYDVIGCSTNRLGGIFQLWNNTLSDERDIVEHQKIALDAQRKYGLELELVSNGNYLAGLFYLFRKKLWNEISFEEKSIQFDLLFCNSLYEKGKTMAIARGLYLFHLYRLGAENPQRAIQHIIHCQDMHKIGEFPYLNFGENRC